jgi:hypothetical protein
VLIALQRIAADEFGQAVGLVRVGGANRAHFIKRDADAAFGELPGRFCAGEATADYCNLRKQVLL